MVLVEPPIAMSSVIAFSKAFLPMARGSTLASSPAQRSGGEDCVDHAVAAVRVERFDMRLEIHPFGLTLLLVHVGDPNKRRPSTDERDPNPRNEQVRDDARVETAGSEHE